MCPGTLADATTDQDPTSPADYPRTHPYLDKPYLAAGRLEHGYARRSYGVQGITQGTARYHPTDLSGFEEGYVAITRGRDADRLYIIDGTIADTDDEAHQTPEAQRFDLDYISDALARRRTGTMAADAADRLPVVHRLATGRTLAELVIRVTGREPPITRPSTLPGESPPPTQGDAYASRGLGPQSRVCQRLSTGLVTAGAPAVAGSDAASGSRRVST